MIYFDKCCTQLKFRMEPSMADEIASKKRKLAQFGVGVGLSVLIIFASLIVFGGYQFSRYRTKNIRSFHNGVDQVVIIDPAMGSQAPLGIPITVNAQAFGPRLFLSIELWVDGQLVKVQGDSYGGSSPLEGNFTWAPGSEGVHSLVVRAVTAEGQSIHSTSTVLLAIANNGAVLPAVDADGNVGGNTAAASAAGSGTYVPPQPPGPGDSSSPGEAWIGSPGEWLTSLTGASAPSAPELVAEAGNCAAALSIHDLSDNEEGFVIYRQVTGSPVWEPVAALASAESDWLTYTDDDVAGGLLYYVAAFNSQGETQSNLTLVNVAAGECADQIANLPYTTLEIASFTPLADTSKNYCYRALNGQGWGRWPQEGYLNSHNEPILISNLDGEMLFESVDLLLECWGWAGDEMLYLGHETFSGLNPHQPGSYQLDLENLSVEVLVNNQADVNIPVMIPYGGGFMDLKAIFHTDFGLETLPQLDEEMPVAIPKLTYNPAECYYHVLLDYPLGESPLCDPFFGFNFGPGGPQPQPYLVWDTSDIYIYSSVGYVGFEIVEHNSLAFKSYTINQDDLNMLVVPPVACGGNRTFRVRMFYKAEGADPAYKVSQWSDPVTVPCFTQPNNEISTDLFTEPDAIDSHFNYIFSVISYSPGQCYNNAKGMGAEYCHPYPGYNAGPGGSHPQPYLIWDTAHNHPETGMPCFMYNDDDCVAYDEYLNYVGTHADAVGFEISETGAQIRRYQVTEPHVMAFTIPPLVCDGERMFKTRWFVRWNESASPKEPYRASKWGNEVSIPCEAAVPLSPLDYVDIDSPPALDLTMPDIDAKISYDPAECDQHLPPSAQNLAGKLLYCWPYDGFDSGPEGANPQPYLIWTPLDQCPAWINWYFTEGQNPFSDSEPPDCKSYSELLYHANSSYGAVGFEIIESNTSEFRTYTVSDDNLTALVIPPRFCTGERTFQVRMFYKSDGANPFYRATEWTYPVSMPCSTPLTSTRIDVSIENLTFSSVKDGESEPQDIEVFGDFYISTSAGERWLVLAQSLFLEDCPDDDDVGFGLEDWLDLDAFCSSEDGQNVCQNWNSSCYKEMTNGSFNLDNMAMCEAYTSANYQAAKNGVCNTGWQLGNNTVRLFVNDNDDLTVNAFLLDYDANSLPEWVCKTTFTSDTFTALQWGAMDEEWYFSSAHADAVCNIMIEVSGIPEGGE
jgi:hypothetical protein